MTESMEQEQQQQQQQKVEPPTEVLELVLHENFWWFFQSPQHHQAVVSTLTAPGGMHTLLDAAFRPSDNGLGLGGGGRSGCTAVFDDGPVKYINMNPGHGASTYLVTLGKGSEPHRLAFSACQVLLTPPLLAALLSDDALLTELFRFVALPAPLPTARAGYFTNLVYQLLEANAGRVAAWIARGSTLRHLLGHIENDSIRRLLCHRIDEVVPIGGKPATGGGTRWLGLLSGGPMLPLLHAEGVDLASVLLEQLRADSSSEALAATAVDACESWAATAAKGPAAAEGVMHASIAKKLLTTFHSDVGAETLLAPLGGGHRGVSSSAATHAVLPLLGALVKVQHTLEGDSDESTWESTPLRCQLRGALPALAGWLLPDPTGGGDEAAPESWCSGAVRVGRLRYAVAGLLAALCGVGRDRFPGRGLQEATTDGTELANSGALAAMVSALFAFPTASVLHASLMGGLRLVIRQRDATTAALFRDAQDDPDAAAGSGGLLSAMTRVYAERCDAQNRRPPPQYYGHLEHLMTLAQECRSIVAGWPSWQKLCEAELAPLAQSVDEKLESVLEPVPGTAGTYRRYPGMKMSLGVPAAEAGTEGSDMIDSPRIDEEDTTTSRASTPPPPPMPLSPPGVRGPGEDEDEDEQWEAAAGRRSTAAAAAASSSAAAAGLSDGGMGGSPPLSPTLTVPERAPSSTQPRGLRDSMTGEEMMTGLSIAATQGRGGGGGPGLQLGQLSSAASGGGSHVGTAGEQPRGSPTLLIAPLGGSSSPSGGGRGVGVSGGGLGLGLGGGGGGGGGEALGSLPPLALPPMSLGPASIGSAALPPPRAGGATTLAPLARGGGGGLPALQQPPIRPPPAAAAASSEADSTAEPVPIDDVAAGTDVIAPEGTAGDAAVSSGDADGVEGNPEPAEGHDGGGGTGGADDETAAAAADASEEPKQNAQKQTRFCVVQ
jgi:hypothetical protein